MLDEKKAQLTATAIAAASSIRTAPSTTEYLRPPPPPSSTQRVQFVQAPIVLPVPPALENMPPQHIFSSLPPPLFKYTAVAPLQSLDDIEALEPTATTVQHWARRAAFRHWVDSIWWSAEPHRLEGAKLEAGLRHDLDGPLEGSSSAKLLHALLSWRASHRETYRRQAFVQDELERGLVRAHAESGLLAMELSSSEGQVALTLSHLEEEAVEISAAVGRQATELTLARQQAASAAAECERLRALLEAQRIQSTELFAARDEELRRASAAASESDFFRHKLRDELDATRRAAETARADADAQRLREVRALAAEVEAAKKREARAVAETAAAREECAMLRDQRHASQAEVARLKTASGEMIRASALDLAAERRAASERDAVVAQEFLALKEELAKARVSPVDDRATVSPRARGSGGNDGAIGGDGTVAALTPMVGQLRREAERLRDDVTRLQEATRRGAGDDIGKPAGTADAKAADAKAAEAGKSSPMSCEMEAPPPPASPPREQEEAVKALLAVDEEEERQEAAKAVASAVGKVGPKVTADARYRPTVGARDEIVRRAAAPGERPSLRPSVKRAVPPPPVARGRGAVLAAAPSSAASGSTSMRARSASTSASLASARGVATASSSVRAGVGGVVSARRRV